MHKHLMKYEYVVTYIYICIHCSYCFRRSDHCLPVGVCDGSQDPTVVMLTSMSKPPIFHYHQWTQWMDLCQGNHGKIVIIWALYRV